MSVALMGAVLDRGPSKGSERSALLAIANAADDFGFAAPSIETIAVACCCNERTVLRNLAALEAGGWLHVKRKVLGGRGNVYFISLEKLAITPNEKSRRSPMWADMQRLLRALDSGDKLSRLNGVLKFERNADSGPNIVTGNLFEEKNSGDKMSPESASHNPQNGSKVARFAASGAVLEEKGPDMASEDENSGDKMSPVTRQNRHLTSDIRDTPFNVLTVTSSVEAKTTTPPTPVPGDGGDELLLPVENCTPDAAEFPASIAIAAHWVMQKLGLSKRRLENTIGSALVLWCRQQDKSLQAAAQLAVANYTKYIADVPLLRWGPWGPARFFAEAYWASPSSWPYDEAKRRAASEASAGVARREDAPDREARERMAIKGYLVLMMTQIARAGDAFQPVVERLRALRIRADEFDPAQIDTALTAIEEELCEQVHAEATEDELRAVRAELEKKFTVYRGRMTAAQIERQINERIAVELLYTRGLPRLGLFFMQQL